MKFISYTNSTFKTISVLIISFVTLLLIIYDLAGKNNLKTSDIVLAILGLSLFGIGFIVSLKDLLTKNRQIAVIRDNSYLLRLYKSKNKMLFVLFSGIQYSLTLFLCLFIALVLGNNLSLLENYWKALLLFYLILTLIGGLFEYWKYKRIDNNGLM